MKRPIAAHSRSSWQRPDRRPCGEAAVPRTRPQFAAEEAPTGRSTAPGARSRTAASRGEASRRRQRHQKDGRRNLVSAKHRKHRRYSRSGTIGPPSFVSAQEHMRPPIGPLCHVARRHGRVSLRARRTRGASVCRRRSFEQPSISPATKTNISDKQLTLPARGKSALALSRRSMDRSWLENTPERMVRHRQLSLAQVPDRRADIDPKLKPELHRDATLMYGR